MCRLLIRLGELHAEHGEIPVMEKLFVSQIDQNPEGNTDGNNMSACLTNYTLKKKRER